MKKDLLSQNHEAMLSDFKMSIPIFAPPSETSTLNNSNGNNKILASPIILMSLQNQDDKKFKADNIHNHCPQIIKLVHHQYSETGQALRISTNHHQQH